MVEKENKIQIASKADNISDLEIFIENLRETESIGDEVYGNILISLTEAVNNGIFHGNVYDESKFVTVEFKRKGDMLSFTVEDEGDGFDFDHLDDPTDPENIEKLTGRGVFLMQQLSDRLIFSNEGSSVEMQFKA